MNQIQYHPWSSPAWHDTVRSLRAKGVVTTAYNSLGGSRFPRDYGGVLPAIAEKHGCSLPQLLLRWALQRGVAVIPGSSDKAHIAENLNGPRFALDDGESASIARPRRERQL